MKEILSELLLAVITAVVPVLTGYGISLIRKASDHFTAKTNSHILQNILSEVSESVQNGVSAVNQTYVSTLKKEGVFTKEAHQKAMEKALEICMFSISQETQAFLDDEYEEITEYLKARIEAEVCKQKSAYGTEILPLQEITTDSTAVAASIAQAALQQTNAEAVTSETEE